MSEFPQIRAANDGVERVIGAVKNIAGSWSKSFGEEAKDKERQKASANLSYAQQSSAEANLAATQKLLKTSAKLDRKQIRTEGSEARKTQKAARKNINKLEAKVGTKLAASTDGKGGFSASFTKAAPAKPAATKMAPKPAARVAKGANPARKGAK